VRAIINYHSIDSSGSAISIAEPDFRRHVRWLASGRVKVVSLDDLVASDDGTDRIALTFDDGFQSFASIAAPLLEEHGLPAALFVATERVGGTNAWDTPTDTNRFPILPLLDWEGIASVAERGISVGSHGKTHRRLTTLDASSVKEELEGSFADIRRELGVSPTVLAYPYGDALAREQESAAAIYNLALTTELRSLGENEGLHMLPRLDAYYLRVPGRLESFGTPAFKRYLRIRSRGRRLRASVHRLLGQDGG
jgi:peptidoglycan/xylan/chitin deacetylase (PgdA/CDA1 family)